MSMTDPIADFLTRIRNGIMAAHETVEIPASRLKREMARILDEQGYIEGFDEAPGVPGSAADKILVRLKYTDEPHVGDLRPAPGVPPGPADATSTPSTSRRSWAAWAPRSCPPRTA